MDDLRQLSATLNPDQRQLLMSGLHSLITAFKANRAHFNEETASNAATLDPLQSVLESINRASTATDQGCLEVWRQMEHFGGG